MFVNWIANILIHKLIELWLMNFIGNDWIMCWFGNESDNVIVMWIVIEKGWVESELDELLEIDWLIDNLIELCLCWELCDWERCWEMRCWEMKCWDVDDGRMNWAFEIVDLRCDDVECNCWAMWIACVWW